MSDFASLSGYTDTDDYLAVAHRQDEISLISVQVAWPGLTKMVKLPDPAIPSAGQRTAISR